MSSCAEEEAASSVEASRKGRLDVAPLAVSFFPSHGFGHYNLYRKSNITKTQVVSHCVPECLKLEYLTNFPLVETL